MNLSEYAKSDSPYLKAADHEGHAKQHKIEEVGVDAFPAQKEGGKDDDFVWVKFSQLEKPIRLNKTTLKAMLAKFGAEGDGWVGKQCFVGTVNGKLGNGNPYVGWNITPLDAAEAPDDDVPF